ncbi:MAG: class I SAM-dependent methyltransferase [Methylocystis sp.]
MATVQDENLFTGPIGREYDMLRLICPNAAALAGRLGDYLATARPGAALRGFEIGCGTGVSTLALLAKNAGLDLVAIDSSAKMLAQARENLKKWTDAGRVDFIEADALDALRAEGDASYDVVASNYATHNFRGDHRNRVIAEVFRVLKPGGLFLNGDRFAIDDRAEHLAHTQSEVRHWFKTFAAINRPDLLEDWIVHLFSDESPEHIMYFTPGMALLNETGFSPVRVDYREGVDTLVAATKPAPVN